MPAQRGCYTHEDSAIRSGSVELKGPGAEAWRAGPLKGQAEEVLPEEPKREEGMTKNVREARAPGLLSIFRQRESESIR